MKVLQIPSWYLPEGGQFCLYQSQALIQEGIEVQILANVTLPWRTYKWKIFSYPFMSFFTIENAIPILRNYFWRIPFLDTLNNKRWINKTVKLFDKYQKKNGLPDIIHAHSSMWAGAAAAIIKEKYKIPYVITEHRGRFSENSEQNASLLPPKYNNDIKLAFSNAAAIIAVSNQLHKKISVYTDGKQQIHTISNIVDTDFFQIERKATNDSENFVFITTNSYDNAKAYDILLPAFDIVNSKFPNTVLYILGSGFENANFKAIFDNTKAKNKIHFPGYQNKDGVLKHLTYADCFVLSSRTESQSVAVLEAMCCGLPIVCTKAVPIEVASNTAAITCNTNDIEALATAMLKMIENYAEYNAIEIRKHAVSICSKDLVTTKIIDVYKSILNDY